MKTLQNRREFLKVSAAGAFGVIVFSPFGCKSAPVVDKKSLAAPLQFPGYGFLDDQFVIAGHEGLDGTPLFRRSADHRQVPDAEKGKLQSPGDRSSA